MGSSVTPAHGTGGGWCRRMGWGGGFLQYYEIAQATNALVFAVIFMWGTARKNNRNIVVDVFSHHHPAKIICKARAQRISVAAGVRFVVL